MKTFNTFLVTTLLASTLLFSCKSELKVETDKTTFDLATAKTEIEAANKITMDAFAKGDSVAIANMYADDAKLMFTGMPAVVGKAGIQSVFGGYIKGGVNKIELKTNEVWGTEDLLAEEGAVTIYVGEQIVGQEKFIVLWKKVGGQWKIIRDIANSDLAPQPTN
ncbi:nuclear transport factor 2 family protein [Sediminibacterium sp.]|uniref:YybH family protein n=1 Tax=Sediminibacterium sp. TaxID=1917865 RepID=UPI0027332746|nr:nuclear transport factor 2 family protein [Sediminibacterium sp.]MDP3394255.1 nuclear transport factor 2 family protein [Sediminibacterium sp.]MDP3567055.1 nuclear transport factor 2 family protein [Sediminibacterium sp.]